MPTCLGFDVPGFVVFVFDRTDIDILTCRDIDTISIVLCCPTDFNSIINHFYVFCAVILDVCINKMKMYKINAPVVPLLS